MYFPEGVAQHVSTTNQALLEVLEVNRWVHIGYAGNDLEAQHMEAPPPVTSLVRETITFYNFYSLNSG